MRIVKQTRRRIFAVTLILLALAIWVLCSPDNYRAVPAEKQSVAIASDDDGQRDILSNEEQVLLATVILAQLEVKEKDNSQKYNREDFYSSWSTYNGCDMRNVILARDLINTTIDECLVMSGTLNDPYTGESINFIRGATTSGAVQIDHVVALSNAWATGAANWNKEKRHELSQDPLNLLAVDGSANREKSDRDASEWLPPNESFQCQYVARQISVKYKYVLWVTPSEKLAMSEVLERCPDESTVGLENLVPENAEGQR